MIKYRARFNKDRFRQQCVIDNDVWSIHELDVVSDYSDSWITELLNMEYLELEYLDEGKFKVLNIPKSMTVSFEWLEDLREVK